MTIDSRVRVSLTALVLANLVPLAGTLFLGWSAGAIVVLCWAENVVVGGYTVLKIWSYPWREERHALARLVLTLGFGIHYGLFMLVHGVFALLIAARGQGRMVDDPWAAVVTHLGDGVVYALLGLVLSHGVSFVVNFWVGGERHRVTLGQIVTQPYPRLVVMHVAILVGAFGVTLIGSPVPAVAALVGLKLGLDVAAHRREHGARTA